MSKDSRNIPSITQSQFGALLDSLSHMPNPPALMVYGPPGVGKTEMVKARFPEEKYDLRVKHLSRMDQTDWSGVPTKADDGYTSFLPIGLFRPIMKGKDNIVIFFDELNTALPQVLNAALDVILEKKGDSDASGAKAILPKKTIIIAAGNLGEEDGTYVEQFSSAVKTRLIQVRMDPENLCTDWLAWANTCGINDKVKSFIKSHKDLLLDLEGFKQNRDQMATPRGWERVSDYLKLLLDKKITAAAFENLVKGTLGEGIARKFLLWLDGETDGEDAWRRKHLEVSAFYNDGHAGTGPKELEKLMDSLERGLEESYPAVYDEAAKFADVLIAGKLTYRPTNLHDRVYPELNKYINKYCGEKGVPEDQKASLLRILFGAR